MSIASEISRLQSAKSAIKTAIENKGVTVSGALTLDGYAAKINDIKPQTYRGGTFTLDSDQASSTQNKTKVSDLDADIISHRNDSNFFMAIFPKFDATSLQKSLAAIRGNQEFTYTGSGGGVRYGFGLYQNTNGLVTQVHDYSVSTDPDRQNQASFWVGADGLYIRGTTSYKWAAGTYNFVCAW